VPGGVRGGLPGGVIGGVPSGLLSGGPGGGETGPSAGALASLTPYGQPLPAGVARRAAASQTRDGGRGAQPSYGATVTRTTTGNDLPSGTVAIEPANTPGAGGLGATQGAMPSALPVGSTATVERAASGAPVGKATVPGGTADSGVGSNLVAAFPSTGRATSGSGPGSAVGTPGAGGSPGSPIGKTTAAANAVAGLVEGVAEGAVVPARGDGVGPARAAVAGSPGGARSGPGGGVSPSGAGTAGDLVRGTGSGGLPVAALAEVGDAGGGIPSGLAAAPRLSRARGSGAASGARGEGAGSAKAIGPARTMAAAQVADTMVALAETAPTTGPGLVPRSPAKGAARSATPGTAGTSGEGNGGVVQVAALGPSRQAGGLPQGIAGQVAVEFAALGGLTGRSSGAAGPRRLPQGADQGSPLLGQSAGGRLGKTNTPGLARAPTETIEPQPLGDAAQQAGTARPGAGEPGSARDSTVGAGAGEVSRQNGGLPVLVAAPPGSGGLDAAPSSDLGVPSRFARPESEVVHTAFRRFLIARSGGGLAVDGTVSEPTESYLQREPGRRAQAVRVRGGSGGTENAVEIGLDFFARTQFADGHWSLHELPPELITSTANSKSSVGALVAEARELLAAIPRSKVEKQLRQRLEDAITKHRAGKGLSRAEVKDLLGFVVGLGQMEADTAATGLALLAYLGAGYTHLDDKHRAVVQRGIDWLVRRQKPSGELFTGGSKFTRFYSHGIAAIALCEAYGMTQDPELREPARKAIDFIVKTQHPTRGGWRYDTNPQTGRSTESDTSVSGWQLMALKSAQMAGLGVPADVLRKIGKWLDTAGAPHEGGRYIYNPHADKNKPEQQEGLKPNLAMTSEAMLMRMYLGATRDDPRLIEGAEYLKANLPALGTEEEPARDCYYWYYATQAMFQLQGEYWTAWNQRMREVMESSQVQKGDLAGSWHPLYPVPDRWGAAGGRLYVTAMHLLMLEVYYRHLPLFQELTK